MKMYVNPQIKEINMDYEDVIKTSGEKVTAENSQAYSSLATADVGGTEVQCLESWF